MADTIACDRAIRVCAISYSLLPPVYSRAGTPISRAPHSIAHGGWQGGSWRTIQPETRAPTWQKRLLHSPAYVVVSSSRIGAIISQGRQPPRAKSIIDGLSERRTIPMRYRAWLSPAPSANHDPLPQGAGTHAIDMGIHHFLLLLSQHIRLHFPGDGLITRTTDHVFVGRIKAFTASSVVMIAFAILVRQACINAATVSFIVSRFAAAAQARASAISNCFVAIPSTHLPGMLCPQCAASSIEQYYCPTGPKIGGQLHDSMPQEAQAVPGTTTFIRQRA